MLYTLGNTGGVVDKHRAAVSVGRSGVGVSFALLFGEHNLHQGPQALAPARSGAPGPAWCRHPAGAKRLRARVRRAKGSVSFRFAFRQDTAVVC